MAGLNKTERKARELYWESKSDDRNWNDLTLEEKAPWVSKATTDMENPPVEPVLDPAGVTHFKAGTVGASLDAPPPFVIRDPLAAYRQSEGRVKIECPVEDRYVITGFAARSVFIPDVGHLSPPAQIDLVLNEDTVPAVEAALADYYARKGVARG